MVVSDSAFIHKLFCMRIIHVACSPTLSFFYPNHAVVDLLLITAERAARAVSVTAMTLHHPQPLLRPLHPRPAARLLPPLQRLLDLHQLMEAAAANAATLALASSLGNAAPNMAGGK